MVLASFDTMAYHLFEMKYKDTSFFISAEFFEDLQYNDNNDYDMLSSHKLNSVNMNIGETIEMIYDFGCEQIFNIELIEISDMPASELLKAIKKIDKDGHSEIYYSSRGSSRGSSSIPEWDYRDYRIDLDNALLKGEIEMIRDGYEGYEY